MKISSSFSSSSQAVPPVIFENASFTCVSTVSNAFKNVCRLSFSTDSMNATIVFRSFSSMFFLEDDDLYPFEISTYCDGAPALSEFCTRFCSDSSAEIVDSTSNISILTSNPNVLRSDVILDSFWRNSVRSRFKESVFLSREEISFV